LLLASQDGETAMPRAKRLPDSAKAKTVTVGKGRRGDAGAVFALAPKVGSVSDQRAANAGMMECEKKGEDKHPDRAGREQREYSGATIFCCSNSRRHSLARSKRLGELKLARSQGQERHSL
jgi:hypothetical protein